MKLRTRGMNTGFVFTLLKKGSKSSLFEVKSIMTDTTFYHVVTNASRKYPENDWPENIYDKSKIKINEL